MPTQSEEELAALPEQSPFGTSTSGDTPQEPTRRITPTLPEDRLVRSELMERLGTGADIPYEPMDEDYWNHLSKQLKLD